MAFFWNQPQFSNSEFAPFLRFLEDCADPSTTNSRAQCKPTASSKQSTAAHFKPKFDIVETDSAYELFGDLPGVAQQDVAVEFPDVQTLTVKGKVVRRQPTAKPAVDEAPVANDANEDDASSVKSKQASVEDGGDEDDDEYMQVDKQGEQAKPATNDASSSKPAAAEATASAPDFKFHLLERKLGQFSRTFSFPAPVDTEAVTASLRDGVLSVRVPKIAKAGVKKISIQ